jgi:hypothetical protein
MLLAEAAQPAEQVRIAAQFGEARQLRKIRLEIGEKATSGDSIAVHRLRSQGDRESLDTGVKDLREQWMGLEAWSVGANELRLERSIPFGGQRSGAQREILGENESGLQRMALGGKIVEEAPEGEQIDTARAIRQGRILFAERANPAEQMGVAAQLRQAKYPREIRLEKGEETAGSGSIVSRRSGERLNPGVKDRLDFVVGRLWDGSHRF